MLQALVDYAVPISTILLMLVAGTEVVVADFAKLVKARRAVLLGTVGQLLALPIIAVLIQSVAAPPPLIAASTLLLALCPGGAISNYYCYLARCNVLLSATITALGTMMSLLTIPLFLRLLPAQQNEWLPLSGVPVQPVLIQLFLFMVLPMAIGILLRHLLPESVADRGGSLRAISGIFIMVILALAVWSVRDTIFGLFQDILVSVVLFIVAAMILGWLLGYGLSDADRSVLVIESGVRNVGVALLLGGAVLSTENFGVFASFLTGYFIVEVIVMLSFARARASRVGA